MSKKAKQMTVAELVAAIRATEVPAEEIGSLVEAAKALQAGVVAKEEQKRQEARSEALDGLRATMKEWGFTAVEVGAAPKRRVFPYPLGEVAYVNNPNPSPHHLAKGVWVPGESRPIFIVELLNKHYDGDTEPLRRAIVWKDNRKK